MIEKIGHLDNGIRKVMNGNYRFLRSRVPARNESKTEEIDHNDSYEGSVTELKRNSYLENLVAMRKDSGQYISKPALFPDTEQTQTRMSQLAMEMYEINDSENGAINSFEVLNELTDNIDLISEEGKEKVRGGQQVLQESCDKMEHQAEERWELYNQYLETELEHRVLFNHDIQNDSPEEVDRGG